MPTIRHCGKLYQNLIVKKARKICFQTQTGTHKIFLSRNSDPKSRNKNMFMSNLSTLRLNKSTELRMRSAKLMTDVVSMSRDT